MVCGRDHDLDLWRGAVGDQCQWSAPVCVEFLPRLDSTLVYAPRWGAMLNGFRPMTASPGLWHSARRTVLTGPFRVRPSARVPHPSSLLTQRKDGWFHDISHWKLSVARSRHQRGEAGFSRSMATRRWVAPVARTRVVADTGSHVRWSSEDSTCTLILVS